MVAQDVQPTVATTPRTLGRYEMLGCIARGGMATVYLARHRGEAGFQRLFAVKVLHPHLADDEGFVSMLLDEARIAARLHHPNVVPIVDLGTQDGLHYVVMEYIEGCSLAALLTKNRDERPPRLILPIVIDVLAGLHAAHTLTDDDGKPMNLVHRDVSPQNVMVGADGVARITDFGIARAESRIMSTRPGQIKGKIAFMSPEQIRSTGVDCRSDLFSAGAMLWSAITGRRLFLSDTDAATLSNILTLEIPPPSTIGLMPPAALDGPCLRALEREAARRFASAQDMEESLREAALVAGCLGSRRDVAAWVTASFGDELADRRKAIKSFSIPPRALSALTSSQPVSGLRMIPAFGSLTPADAHTPTPSASRSQAPTALHTYEDLTPRRRSRPWVMVGSAAVALAAAAAAVLLLRGPAAPTPTPSTAATTTGGHAVSPPVVDPTAAVTPAPPPSPVVEAPKPLPSAKHAAAGRRSAAAPARAEKPTTPAPAPAPTPTPAAAEPPKKPTTWDRDSPLPPP